MKILGLGGIVPWIGFRTVRVPCEVAAEMGIHQTRLAEDNMDEVWIDAFEVEWLGFGCCLMARGIA